MNLDHVVLHTGKWYNLTLKILKHPLEYRVRYMGKGWNGYYIFREYTNDVFIDSGGNMFYSSVSDQPDGDLLFIEPAET